MKSDGWNIHGWIALPIEMTARKALSLDEVSIRNTFLSADRIEASSFVEAMLYLLRQKQGLQADFSDFARACHPLLGKPLQLIDRETISALYAQFQILYTPNPDTHQPDSSTEVSV